MMISALLMIGVLGLEPIEFKQYPWSVNDSTGFTVTYNIDIPSDNFVVKVKSDLTKWECVRIDFDQLYFDVIHEYGTQSFNVRYVKQKDKGRPKQAKMTLYWYLPNDANLYMDYPKFLLWKHYTIENLSLDYIKDHIDISVIKAEEFKSVVPNYHEIMFYLYQLEYVMNCEFKPEHGEASVYVSSDSPSIWRNKMHKEVKEVLKPYGYDVVYLNFVPDRLLVYKDWQLRRQYRNIVNWQNWYPSIDKDKKQFKITIFIHSSNLDIHHYKLYRARIDQLAISCNLGRKLELSKIDAYEDIEGGKEDDRLFTAYDGDLVFLNGYKVGQAYRVVFTYDMPVRIATDDLLKDVKVKLMFNNKVR